MFISQSEQLPYLKSLSHCLNKIRTGGYTESFEAVDSGLCSLQTKRVYQPGEVKVVNFFRFEGVSDHRENAIMYIIETCDGLKGTLVKPYDPYVDPAIDAFIVEGKDTKKK